jgi:hypothetical protein
MKESNTGKSVSPGDSDGYFALAAHRWLRVDRKTVFIGGATDADL